MTKMKVVLDGATARCTHELGATLDTDAPKEIGGEGKCFSPTDLLALSLGTCMLITMGLSAKKLGFDMKGSSVEIEKEMGGSTRRVSRVVVRIRCPKVPSEGVREKLEAAAWGCPVHHSLHPETRQEVDFLWGL